MFILTKIRLRPLSQIKAAVLAAINDGRQNVFYRYFTEEAMRILSQSLKRTPIFSHLSLRQISQLLEQSPVFFASAGSKIEPPQNPVKHHLLVLDGDIKSNNSWLYSGNEMHYCWHLQSDESQRRFATLSSATKAIKARALVNTRYMIIDGDAVEQLENQTGSLNSTNTSGLHHKCVIHR